MALDEGALTLKQQEYLDWLCTAPPERVPPSKRKYADDHHMSTETLRLWEKKPAFRDEWKRRVDDIQGSPEKTLSLLESLYSRAMAGDMKAADLYLRTTGRMAPQPIKVETTHQVAELSDSDLDALIAASASRERDVRAGTFASETPVTTSESPNPRSSDQ